MKINGYTIKPYADLRSADLRFGALRYASLTGSDLRKVSLSEADLRFATLRDADLRGAILYRADMSSCCLVGANLRGADLERVIGNSKEITTLQTPYYHIAFTKHEMQIGCRRYSLKKWFRFTLKEIDYMDSKALEFWKVYKPILKALLKARGFI